MGSFKIFSVYRSLNSSALFFSSQVSVLVTINLNYQVHCLSPFLFLMFFHVLSFRTYFSVFSFGLSVFVSFFLYSSPVFTSMY